MGEKTIGKTLTLHPKAKPIIAPVKIKYLFLPVLVNSMAKYRAVVINRVRSESTV